MWGTAWSDAGCGEGAERPERPRGCSKGVEPERTRWGWRLEKLAVARAEKGGVGNEEVEIQFTLNGSGLGAPTLELWKSS